MRLRFDHGVYPIAPRVYVGGMPRTTYDDGLDVDLLVLCAGKWTPDDARVNPVLDTGVWWIPLRDDGVEGPDPGRLPAVRAALREAKRVHDRGGTVAFTCLAGRNRSGLQDDRGPVGRAPGGWRHPAGHAPRRARVAHSPGPLCRVRHTHGMISEHTRLHPADEADLRWRWTQAAGELGERSAMGPMIDRMSEGRTHASGTDPDADGDRMARMMEAAGRVRRIDARLARILLLHQRTLLATYGPGATPGELAGLEWLDSHAIPLSLIRLTARRAGFDIERLRAKGTPPPEVRAPARPDTAGARTSDAKDDPASRRAQADAARQRLAAWKAKRDADVAPLRLAASTALDEACAAYNTTRTEAP